MTLTLVSACRDSGKKPEYGTVLWAMRGVMQLCQGRVLRSSDFKKQFLQASVWLISSTASRPQVLRLAGLSLRLEWLVGGGL